MIVVKFGGHAMKDENGNFAKAILAALDSGEKVVVVHGGGPQIDAALKAKQIQSNWIGGFRVTTQEIFDVVEEVLVNQVGNEVASTLAKSGIKTKAISAREIANRNCSSSYDFDRWNTCRSWFSWRSSIRKSISIT
jgi:acetylglutamate kinase